MEVLPVTQPPLYSAPIVTPPPPPQGPPPAQPQGQPPQGPGAADLNQRIRHNDPNFPQELWGKTLGDAMRFYSIMRQDFVARHNAGQPPQGQPPVDPRQRPAPQGPPAQSWNQPPAQQPPAQQSPQGQPPRYGAPPVAAPPAGFVALTDVGDMIEQAIARAMAPQTAISVETVYRRVAGEFQDWSQHALQVQEAVRGADPSTLLNPEVWRAAYYFVKGRALSQGGDTTSPPAPSVPVTGPVYNLPPQQTGFFAEGPSAPPAQFSGQPNTGAGLTSEQRLYARRFGMTDQQYIDWSHGNVPAMPQGNGGRPEGGY